MMRLVLRLMGNDRRAGSPVPPVGDGAFFGARYFGRAFYGMRHFG